VLINAAKQAGVRRFVHVSITNPSENSPLPYFRGKWQVERAIIESGLSYAILRSTVASGPEDILVNNIAWLLRKFPLFAIPGSGEYRLQPIFVGDLAELAVQGGDSDLNFVRDAVGPETFTFNDLVRRVAQTVGSRAALVHTPPRLAWMLYKVIGLMTGDVTLTEDEVQGLMDARVTIGFLMCSSSLPVDSSFCQQKRIDA